MNGNNTGVLSGQGREALIVNQPTALLREVEKRVIQRTKPLANRGIPVRGLMNVTLSQ